MSWGWGSVSACRRFDVWLPGAGWGGAGRTPPGTDRLRPEAQRHSSQPYGPHRARFSQYLPSARNAPALVPTSRASVIAMEPQAGEEESRWRGWDSGHRKKTRKPARRTAYLTYTVRLSLSTPPAWSTYWMLGWGRCASKDSVISSNLWRLISPLPTAVFLSRTKDGMHFQKRMSHNGFHPARI